MERVRDAIARAREQRESLQGENTGEDGGPENPGTGSAAELPAEASVGAQAEARSRAPVVRETARPTSRRGSVSPADIEYTRTRSETLEEKVLLKNRVVAGFRHDERAEVYRQLRSQIVPKMKANGWRTLAITSPNENAGKTLTAVNLAISISQEVNQTVLLVDLDLRSPSVHETLGVDTGKGIADCIIHGEPIENVLLNPQFKRLVVLPGRALGEYSSELLTSPNMQAIMDEIVGRYESRIIVFDLPPLLRNDDALVFTPKVDATLMVVEDGRTSASEIKRSLHLLENSNLIGTILNKAR